MACDLVGSKDLSNDLPQTTQSNQMAKYSGEIFYVVG